ncbi:hypothetical protein O3M35_010049 [Rhynocoris fuscipes]|uniref:RecA family profile 1 domain-containing protein n=1 Tax=Rhynocoris fuscipes TaxID=488301 RepID=A0AAW1D0N8_9HEMI
MDNNEFQKIGNFSISDIEQIKTVAAHKMLPLGFITAKESELIYHHKWRNLCIDCPYLDAILGGGIPARGITEISGESGVGKTQFCLQLSLTVQYPPEFGGFNASAVYICTEDRFPSARLTQMLPHFPKNPHCKTLLENHQFSDNILIDHIGDMDGLNNCLFKRLPRFLANSPRKVGLLIIDSIAAIFRSEYSLNEIINRAKDIRTVAMQLHNLANEHDIAVLCVNQVTDQCDSGLKVPALGLAWANLVTTKLQINLSNHIEKLRTLKIISAPHLPPSSANFIIAEHGLESVS